MIPAMPRERAKRQFVEKFKTRHGSYIFYFRAGKGARIRLPDDPASEAFDAEYKAALVAHLGGEMRKTSSDRTLGWLVDQYRESPEYAALAPETLKQFRYQFRRMKERAGAAPISELTLEGIMKGRAERAAKAPSDANKYVRAIKKLLDFAVANGWAADNPAKDIGKLPTAKKKGKEQEEGAAGFLVWGEEDLALYERRWPVGTRERLAMDLLLYTGVRRSDVVRLGRQHMRKNGEIVIRTQKSVNSGRPVEVTITILPPLARSIEATPTGDLTFLITQRGKPFKKASFGNWFKKACKAAGVDEPGKAAHGLRKVAATRAAEAGATEAELNAMFGWADGSKESSVYIRTANRAKLARSGTAKIITISPNLPQTGSKTQ